MWRFADLDDEQKLERRHLLDTYGATAQLAALAPLLVLQVYFATCWVREKWQQRSELEIPSSPYLKERQLSSRLWGLRRRVRRLWRRAAWQSGEKVCFWGFEATLGEMGAVGLWTGMLLVLSMVDTKQDYLHLTKRFGIVGASQLPLHYLLAPKTPYSPLQVLTRCSWETLNTLHQLLGRVITLLFYLHAALYLNFFVQAHVLAKRVKDVDVILGLVAVASFTVVGTTALSWVRKRNYRLFYAVHVTLATILLPVLYFHVHHIRLYIWETLAVYSIHIATRLYSESTVSATVALVRGTNNLLDIRIPLSGKSAKKLASWQPGQHVYLSLQQDAGLNVTKPVKTKNPFTIASLPSEDGGLRLIARILDGNTAALAAKARTAGTGSAAVTLAVEGPYGLSTHSVSLLRYARVLFVAGGVGATFVVPLYTSLLRDLSPSAGSRRRQNVTFAWVVRDAAEVGWAVPADEKEAESVRERMRVFVTRATGAAGLVGAGERGRDGMASAKDERVDDDEDGVELERLLSSGHGQGETSLDSEGQSRLGFKIGRPDLRALVNETFAGTGENDRVAVFVCGPKGLAKDVRKEVGRWNETREVWFWSEEFGL